MLVRKLMAEFLGTFWLVFGGCGSAIFAAAVLSGDPGNKFNLGIGFVGVSLAFGLTVLTMAYAIGPISGCHLNPAVTLGLFLSRRVHRSDVLPYMATQVLAGIVAAGALYLIASGQTYTPGQAQYQLDTSKAGYFATNGYAEFSPNGYNMVSCLLAEVILTFFFLMIILGATDRRAPVGFAPLAAGLGLTLIHLIGIPITNLSVNPARSTGPALVAGGAAVSQLWLFWLAPLAGAALAGLAYRTLEDPAVEVVAPAPTKV